jgi:hypothetical protein
MHRLETVAAAYGRNAQMQVRMLRMPAFINEALGSFSAGPDLCKLLIILMMLTEMSAQSALSFLKMNHDVLLHFVFAPRISQEYPRETIPIMTRRPSRSVTVHFFHPPERIESAGTRSSSRMAIICSPEQVASANTLMFREPRRPNR